ncbi:unnamed protein product [Didymodactylos carnosus]|uniref:Uncharacterized protein n=1 Tax=Didymodactylos carnosus TaxID=1234261 RepID=A0A815TH89_9BILA|nr:unnamed protein product [Didymodactylos carnosus]CAF4364513.1 unnamed protein product [Didymodactylos carnosus]
MDARNETQYAAIMGPFDAEQHGGGVARFIGVMPHNSNRDLTFECLTSTQLVIHSGLSSLDRDPINGTTPDALICFGGGLGTICELAFGISAGREAIFHENCAQNLLDICTKNKRDDIEQILSQLAVEWQTHIQLPDGGAVAIIDILTEYLRKAVDRVPLTSAPPIVQAVLDILPNQLPDIPAFPGLLDSHRKQQQLREFATLWTILSKDAP